MTRDPMSDQELDRLLSMASDPVPPAGAEDRLLSRVNTTAEKENVVAFQPRSRLQRNTMPLLAGLPLAASLAFGLWLGVAGVGTDILPESLGGTVAAAEDSILSGIDDAELLAEDTQT